MKPKFLAFLFLLFAQLTANSQSIYRLQYKSPVGTDSITYDAFFVRYDNGAGFVRVSYTTPVTHTTVKVGMKMWEDYAQQADGMPDTNKLVYKTSDLTIVEGESNIQFIPVIFWFKAGPDKNFEPWGITATPEDTLPPEGNFLSASFIKSADITSDLLLEFFTRRDAFYANLYGLKTKGGMLSAEEKKTRIFLMIVASTNDSAIGASTLVDAGKVIQTFSDMAEYFGIRKNMVIDTIFGSRYNKKSVDSILKKRNPSPADMVIFYYSGHGFCQKEEATKKFPFLDLRDPRIRPRVKPATQAMNIEDIYNTIVKKGARLNLVISDCCNNEVIAKKTEATPPPLPRGSNVKWNWENTKALFMSKERFSLLITAASKGEKAIGTDSFGGFFTHFFLASLTAYLSPGQANPKWIQVMADAQTQTILKADSFKRQQHPRALTPGLLK